MVKHVMHCGLCVMIAKRDSLFVYCHCHEMVLEVENKFFKVMTSRCEHAIFLSEIIRAMGGDEVYSFKV